MPLVPIHLKLNISSLDGQMSTRWPWMEIFPKLYQMFSVARLSALGDSRLALHWYYFIWMRWMQGISSKHLLKTVQSIVALMSRPMPSEIINVLISQIKTTNLFHIFYDFHFALEKSEYLGSFSVDYCLV